MNALLQNLPVTRIKLMIARMLYFLVKPFYGTGKRIITRGGLRFEVDITEGLDLSLFLFGNFQRHVYDNKFIRLAEDAVIMDIGANVGIMSLKFAKGSPNGKVYAFEPTHYALQKLERNLNLNEELGQLVVTINSFISSKEQKASQIKAFSSWRVDRKIGDDQHPVHGGKAMSTEGVPITTLDDFVEDQAIDRIDFIKIDTDGHEFDVLSGARQSIRKFRPIIIFELGQYVMEERGISFMDYEQLFGDLGYSMSDAANNKPIASGNYKRRIPKQGTIDILARPISTTSS
jgi:FkbM family methyltransferase